MVDFSGQINPMQVYNFIRQGRLEGEARGKQSRLAQLYSQAIGAGPDQQQDYVRQIAALDPQAAMAARSDFGKMSDEARQSFARDLQVFGTLSPDQKAQFYPTLVQHADRSGFGVPVPRQYDPSMDANLAKLAQVLGGGGNGSDVHSAFRGQNGNMWVLGRDGQVRDTGAAFDPNNQIIDSGNGFFGVNKTNLQAAPVMVGGQQQAPSGFVQTPSGGVNIDPSIPPEIRAQIAANPDAFAQGGTVQGAPVVRDGQPGGLPPPLDYQNGGQLRSVPKPPAAPTQLQLNADARDQARLELAQQAAAGGKPLSAYQQQQLQIKAGKAKAALSGTVADLDRMGQAVRKVMNSPGLSRITGIMGAIPNIPGSDAANAEADLDALKSQIAFAVLAKMRAMSPTGGALGNVSDAEGRRLEANLAALDKAQSADQMKARLQDILDYIESSKGNLRDAFDEQYGNPQQAAPQSGGSDLDALLSKYGAK